MSGEEQARTGPGLYRHYKGGLYRVLFLAQDSTNRRTVSGPLVSTEEPMVVYVALDGEHAGNICVRAAKQWVETVSTTRTEGVRQGGPHQAKVQRFQWIGE